MKKTSNDIQNAWANSISSFNRYDDDWYLKDKAKELSDIIISTSNIDSIIDLGCGAGELLEHLNPLIKTSKALDFSSSMLDQAKNKNIPNPPEFILADIFSYLPTCNEPIWMTTGALNQYLNKNELDQLLDIFTKNDSAHDFYLFDTIDPIRLCTVSMGSSYILGGRKRRVRSILKTIWEMLKLSHTLASNIFTPTFKLKGSLMGYGHLPSVWHEYARLHNLTIKIVSSRYFEYRYHVIIQK